MIYLLFACFCVFFICSWFRIWQVDKHDGVLFPFCQLRRDIISFLYENVLEKPGALSKEEYLFMRWLLGVINVTIHNYNQHKTVMFDMREMLKHLKMYERASQTTLQVPDHPEIRKINERARRLLVKAFLAYTPLIRSRLILKVIISAYRAGYREAQSRAEAEYVANHVREVRNDARRYGLIRDGAAA